MSDMSRNRIKHDDSKQARTALTQDRQNHITIRLYYPAHTNAKRRDDPKRRVNQECVDEHWNVIKSHASSRKRGAYYFFANNMNI